MEKLLNVTGLYHPGFMFVELYDNDNATLYHEYVHYLQSVTTLHGIEAFANSKEIVLRFVKYFKTNVDIDDSVIEHSQVYSRHFKCTPYNSLEFSLSPTDIRPKYEVHDLHLELLVNNVKTCFLFNSTIINENMARIVESHLFPLEKGQDKLLEYDICIPLIKWYCPEKEIDERFACYLCDLSLLSKNPVYTFFILLDEINANTLRVDDYEKLYDFTIHSILAKCITKACTLKKLLSQDLDKCMRIVDKLYNNKMHTEDVAKFLHNTFSKAIEHRINNPYFIYDLMTKEPIESKNILNNAIRYINVPITIMPNGFPIVGALEEYDTYKNILFLVAENEIMKVIFKKPDYKCGMQNICLNAIKNNDRPDNKRIHSAAIIGRPDSACNDIKLKAINTIFRITGRKDIQDNEYIRTCPITVLWYNWKLNKINDSTFSALKKKIIQQSDI